MRSGFCKQRYIYIYIHTYLQEMGILSLGFVGFVNATKCQVSHNGAPRFPHNVADVQWQRLVQAGTTHRPLSSSFLGLPYRILNINHKKELLRGLWVPAQEHCRTTHPHEAPSIRGTSCWARDWRSVCILGSRHTLPNWRRALSSYQILKPTWPGHAIACLGFEESCRLAVQA